MGGKLAGVGERAVKILIDMNLSPKFVELFAKRGVHAAHWADIGAPDAKDIVIMDFASESGYIL